MTSIFLMSYQKNNYALSKQTACTDKYMQHTKATASSRTTTNNKQFLFWWVGIRVSGCNQSSIHCLFSCFWYTMIDIEFLVRLALSSEALVTQEYFNNDELGMHMICRTNILKKYKYGCTNVLKGSKIYDCANVLKESKIYGHTNVLRLSLHFFY